MRRVANAGDLAAAQHGAGGAERTDFVQLVADVQNAAAFGGQLAQHHKELVDGLRRQHRGRLVQNQHARVGQQGADDFNALHFAHAQRVHRPRRVNVQAIFRGLGRDALRDLGQRQLLVQAQPDIFCHRDAVKQIEMLKHHADAQRPRLLRVADAHRHAVDHDAAGVRLDRAVDDLHQRGLAGAVFAQHGMNLAGLHSEGDIAVGDHCRIALGDAAQHQAGAGGRPGMQNAVCRFSHAQVGNLRQHGRAP